MVGTGNGPSVPCGVASPQVQSPVGTAMDRDAIRRWRAEHGISQARLAQVLHVGARSVFAWESGERKVPRWLELALPEVERRVAAQRRHREYRLRVKRDRWARELRRRDQERRDLAQAVRDPGTWW